MSKLTKEEILKQGGFTNNKISTQEIDLPPSLSITEVSQLLNINENKIYNYLNTQTIYGFKVDQTWKFPLFQFDEKTLVPGISKVIQALPADLHPVEVLNWFSSFDPDLSMSPLEWLRSGNDPKELIRIVEDL